MKLLLILTLFLWGCANDTTNSEPLATEPVWTLSEMADLFGVTEEQIHDLIARREQEAEAPTELTAEQIEQEILELSAQLALLMETPVEDAIYCIQADLEGCISPHPLETAIEALMEKWYELTGLEAFG